MRSIATKPLAALALLLAVMTPAIAQPTLEQMAGQMIVIGFQGDDVDDPAIAALREDLAASRLGGIMYLKTNVKSLDTVRAMNAAFRAASPDLVPFITLDQEGGAVERLTRDVGFTEVPSAADVAKSQDPAAAKATYLAMAKGIADLGFSVNFGPVADINVNPNNQIIARFGRAFGTDSQTVATYDHAFIAAHHEAGLATALKHFPGHGSSTADSHEGFVDISKTWNAVELDPYRALIVAGYNDMVMVGHLYHADYADPGTQNPASLSKQWITGVLREQLGFQGVVISDDLEMGAIRQHYTLRETVTMAVRAGMDVLLFSNTAQYHASLGAEILEILISEANADPAFAARIEESYKRIIALKDQLG